jgi:hypothetical protein
MIIIEVFSWLVSIDDVKRDQSINKKLSLFLLELNLFFPAKMLYINIPIIYIYIYVCMYVLCI